MDATNSIRVFLDALTDFWQSAGWVLNRQRRLSTLVRPSILPESAETLAERRAVVADLDEARVELRNARDFVLEKAVVPPISMLGIRPGEWLHRVRLDVESLSEDLVVPRFTPQTDEACCEILERLKGRMKELRALPATGGQTSDTSTKAQYGERVKALAASGSLSEPMLRAALAIVVKLWTAHEDEAESPERSEGLDTETGEWVLDEKFAQDPTYLMPTTFNRFENVEQLAIARLVVAMWHDAQRLGPHLLEVFKPDVLAWDRASENGTMADWIAAVNANPKGAVLRRLADAVGYCQRDLLDRMIVTVERAVLQSRSIESGEHTKNPAADECPSTEHVEEEATSRYLAGLELPEPCAAPLGEADERRRKLGVAIHVLRKRLEDVREKKSLDLTTEGIEATLRVAELLETIDFQPIPNADVARYASTARKMLEHLRPAMQAVPEWPSLPGLGIVRAVQADVFCLFANVVLDPFLKGGAVIGVDVARVNRCVRAVEESRAAVAEIDELIGELLKIDANPPARDAIERLSGEQVSKRFCIEADSVRRRAVRDGWDVTTTPGGTNLYRIQDVLKAGWGERLTMKPGRRKRSGK